MGTLFDWSATAGSNTTVDGVNIAEGCPSGGINNAIRSVMALIRNSFSSGLASFLSGASALAIANGGTGGTSAAAARSALDVYSTGQVDALVSGGIPSGAVSAFAMSTAPSGWLECNGAAVSRSTYAALFTAIGTTFGTGDGSSTFNLPDLRGEFVRGWDHGRGVDGGRALGSAQADDLKSHSHNVYVDYAGGAGGSWWGAGGAKDSTEAGIATGGTETRPRNVALMYCIKA